MHHSIPMTALVRNLCVCVCVCVCVRGGVCMENCVKEIKEV